MATEYVRVYKFARQNNYAGPRKVAWTKFAVSGDTDKTIGQITGMRYSHYHTSNDNPTRSLRGRITLADGTVFVSNADSHKFQDNVVQFVNTFASLPTAEQFSQIASIETINESGYNDNTGYSARLYWRATSDCPMTVTVTFVETPPARYLPEIADFDVYRATSGGAQANNGTYLLTDLKLRIGDAGGLSDNMRVRIYYAENAEPTESAPYVDLSGRVNELLAGVKLNGTILNQRSWGAGSSWMFRAEFRAGDEVDRMDAAAGRAFAPMHISKCATGGVAFGGFSTSAEGNPKAEFFDPVYLYGGLKACPDLFYANGNTETITTGFYNGYVTSSNKTIIIDIPLYKSLRNIGRVSCSKLQANIANAGGYGATSSTVSGGTDYTSQISNVSINKASNSVIITLTRSNAYDLSNNANLQCRVVQISLTFHTS